MEEKCLDEPVYQYYTIIDENLENETENDATKPEDQVVYLFNNEDITDSELNLNNELQDLNSITTLGSNVKIITLDDGRMFMTTNEDDETYESIEPHLLTSQDFEQDEMVQIESSMPSNYEIVGVMEEKNEDEDVVEMVYCDIKPKAEKKQKKFKCFYDQCDKVYGTSYHLTVHMRNHMKSKPFECTAEGCGKKFATNYTLKAHIRTHTGEKPYACGICPKQFKTSGDLQKHIRVHTGVKPFVCPIEGCGRSFSTSNTRKVHIRSHTGERPYSCEVENCGKAFASLTNYKNHVRIHSGEKPFVCSVENCGKRFTEYSSLHKHNLVHQSDRPFMCLHCGHKFKHESALTLHKKIKHKIVITPDGTEIVVNFIN